jgi:hypothetical protein
MSRFGLEDDGNDDRDDVRPDTDCVDCGDAFAKAVDDLGPSLCDGCSDRHDAHTSALELRMATAALPARTAIA